MTFRILDEDEALPEPGSALEIWYIENRDVPLAHLGVGNIARAVRQKLYLDEIIPIALKMVEADPLDGFMTDGEIILALKQLPPSYWQSHPEEKAEFLRLADAAFQMSGELDLLVKEADLGQFALGQQDERSGQMAEIRVEETIGASRHTVWEAWADAAKLSVWFTTNAEHDFRVGGLYKNSDGDTGTYLRIEPENLIEFTWDNKDHSPGTRVVVSLADSGGATLITLRHEGLADEKCAADMTLGWSWAMASLKQYLETGTPIDYEAWLEVRRASYLVKNSEL